MTDGYIYCFSHSLMPGVLKIGMTERTPKERLSDANSNTWSLPLFQIEFAKKVCNALEKEKTLHILLEQYTERLSSRREFFRVSPEEVRKFFDLMDGEMWSDTEEKGDDEDDNLSETTFQSSTASKKSPYDMSKIFTHGQRIRHTIGVNKTWIGIYDSSKNGIIYDGDFYPSLSNFALTHHRVYNPSRQSANGWDLCECEINGEWIITKLVSKDI